MNTRTAPYRLTSAPAALAVAIFAVAPAAFSAELKFECPLASLPAESVEIKNPPAGWTPFTPSFLPLHGVGLRYGHPSKKQDSKPYSEVKNKHGGWTVTWKMEPSDVKPTEGMWMSCGYGEANEVTLSKPLPLNISECTVTSTVKDKASFPAFDIRCKTGK
ncbi:hypothetical protein AAKU55_002485 [Oxalobacteraceae bacterium GrIS 1.11]